MMPQGYIFSLITFSLSTICAEVGSVVKVTYKGSIMLTSPVQIRATKWELSDDLVEK